MADAENDSCLTLTSKFLKLYWRAIILVTWPFLSMIVFLISFEKKIRCLYVVSVMAGYWVTECIPLYITGLIPVFLLPLLQVQDTASVCPNYFNKTNMLFVSSLFLAATIEYSGLHYRIALYTMKCMGCSPRRLHLGLTLVTMFLSMWLINSAATAMMCPIIFAVLQQLEDQGICKVYKPPEPGKEDEPPRPTNITTAYFLTVAYASTIGGIATLVGTGTNLTFKGLYETRFPEGNKIEFLHWALFNIPAVLVITIVENIALQVLLMGMCRPKSEEYEIVKKGTENQHIVRDVIYSKITDLGPMMWKEMGVLILFIALVLLWMFRSPQFITGWGDLFTSEKIADASPALFIIFLLIALPASFSCVFFCSKDVSKRPTKNSPGLVQWKILQDKMPWGLIFLLGGGFALSDAGKKSGLSFYLGEKLSVMANLHPFLVLGITSLFASFLTEMTSNVAICNILIPVLMEMSIAMKTHPMLFTFPAAVNCSFAFLLPVGTPPNAIVLEQANIRTIVMIKCGLVVKLVSWLSIYLLFPTYGRLFYDTGEFPDWAVNSTTYNMLYGA